MFRRFERQTEKIIETKPVSAAIWSTIIAFIVCLIVTLIIFIVNFSSAKNFHDVTKTGSLGDTFNGLLGPFIAFLVAILTFLAFYIQYKANEQQKCFIKSQSFEDIFFRLIENHQRIVESIDIVDKKDATRVIAKSRDCFRIMYKYLEKKNESIYGSDVGIDAVNDTYDKIQARFKSDLHHYFRLLYHILKFIKKSEIKEDEKYKYSSILRAMLSPYEIVFIFYNCLHEYGASHFKPLVEEFSFLKNLDHSLLLDGRHKLQYHPLAFASSSERASLLKQWQNQRKQ